MLLPSRWSSETPEKERGQGWRKTFLGEEPGCEGPVVESFNCLRTGEKVLRLREVGKKAK